MKATDLEVPAASPTTNTDLISGFTTSPGGKFYIIVTSFVCFSRSVIRQSVGVSFNSVDNKYHKHQNIICFYSRLNNNLKFTVEQGKNGSTQNIIKLHCTCVYSLI